ncbi:MAG TPA: hypothetical protein ENK47_01315 [Euryarchaeota archaeon]|nr:MAG: hypothetical protein B6U90_00490 [Thermoplasmatales archaeon ex4484_6]RLF69471.1 MAG: hypothetical protein DRN57_00760 [Thermoplasmata archaeon]HHD15329.1 hypothetical protein [Euryarchaeota archaeon]
MLRHGRRSDRTLISRRTRYLEGNLPRKDSGKEATVKEKDPESPLPPGRDDERSGSREKSHPKALRPRMGDRKMG